MYIYIQISKFNIAIKKKKKKVVEEESLELGIWALPEGCIAHILSLTSPRDACRCSAVSSEFRSAAESDTVWERFLPWQLWMGTISRSVSPVEFSSKKDLYFHLSHSPILLDQGRKSFALDKASGKTSCMLGPEELSVHWNNVSAVWDMNIAMPYLLPYIKPVKSRFLKVCGIDDVSYLKIRGRIKAKLLSPNTTYAAYLVFVHKLGGFKYPTMKVSVRLVREGDESKIEEVVNDAYLLTTVFTPQDGGYRCRNRSDGWSEIEMGEFFNGQDDDVEVEMKLWEIRENSSSVFVVSTGLVDQGIDIRPKEGLN